MNSFKIGRFEVGTNRTFIIAELSGNHNGNLQIALDSIKAAKNAGADAIKLQTYTADTMTLDIDKEEFLCNPNGLWKDRKLYDLYKEAATPWDWHKELFDYAKTLDIEIFSSPFDSSAVDFLETLNPPAYKIASFEITDYELIRYVASKQRPILISTGVATIQEIQDVIDICLSEKNDKIVLLKCTSAYPAALEEANLLTIPNIEQTFNVYSGFSDHTLGIVAPVVSVALGAKVIEKHFILDKSINGSDVAFSLDKYEFEEMVASVRDTEKLLGKVSYSLDSKKCSSRRSSRSLYITKDLKKGDILSLDNVKSIRPGNGLHPKYLNEVLGTYINKDIKKGTALCWDIINSKKLKLI